MEGKKIAKVTILVPGMRILLQRFAGEDKGLTSTSADVLWFAPVPQSRPPPLPRTRLGPPGLLCTHRLPGLLLAAPAAVLGFIL